MFFICKMGILPAQLEAHTVTVKQKAERKNTPWKMKQRPCRRQGAEWENPGRTEGRWMVVLTILMSSFLSPDTEKKAWKLLTQTTVAARYSLVLFVVF